MNQERRVPVQGDGSWWLRADDKRTIGSHYPGTISWTEHELAWNGYDKKYGCGQSAERIAERGGFSYIEIVEYLGREPETYIPFPRKR